MNEETKKKLKAIFIENDKDEIKEDNSKQIKEIPVTDHTSDVEVNHDTELNYEDSTDETRFSSTLVIIMWIYIIFIGAVSIYFLSKDQKDIALYFFLSGIVAVIAFVCGIAHFKNQETTIDLLKDIANSIKNN